MLQNGKQGCCCFFYRVLTMQKYSLVQRRFLASFLFIYSSFFSSQNASAENSTQNTQSSVAQKNSLLTLGFGKTRNDFFGDGTSTIKPDSRRISLARQFSEQWIVEISYQEEKGNGRFLLVERDLGDLFDSAKTKSKNAGISILWLADDFGLGMSYSSGDSAEESEVFLPHVVEKLNSDQQAFSLSYDRSFEFETMNSSNQWSVDWSAGLQYAKFDVAITEQFLVDPVITANSRIKQSSTSIFSDLTLAYWVAESSFIWSPYVTFSWSWELSSDGEQLTLISRGDREVILDEPGSRFSNAIRRPDSGTVDLGFDFLWDNGFSTNIGYSRDIATNFDSEQLFVDVSVAF